MITPAALVALSRAVAQVRARGLSFEEAQELTSVLRDASDWTQIPEKWLQALAPYVPAELLPPAQRAARAVGARAMADAIELRHPGDHDQSVHNPHKTAGMGGAEAFQVPNHFAIDENSLVAATPPHVGLSEKAGMVRARISDQRKISETMDGNKLTTEYAGAYKGSSGDDFEISLTQTLNQETGDLVGKVQIHRSAALGGTLNERLVGEMKYNSVGRYIDTPKPTFGTISRLGTKVQRQGLAGGMLEFARLVSPLPILHSKQKTADGKAFAASHRSMRAMRATGSLEIWDLDGSILDGSGEVRPEVLAYLKGEAKSGERIAIVSARPASELAATERRLKEAGVPYDEIHLNDFSEQPGPNVGLAFKEYKYGKLIEEYGLEGIAYVVDNDPEVRAMARELGLEAYTYQEALAEEDSEDSMETEARAIRLTDKMRASAQKGLGYWADGLAGDGLKQQTVNEARAIARGEIDAEKVVRMAAWIARHRIDWEGKPENSDPDNDQFPGAGAVAAYLWAVDPTDAEDADRVIDWCSRYKASEGDLEEGREKSKETNMAKIGIERRTLTGEPLQLGEDGRTFTGYAALFDSPSEGLGFREIIKPGAFSRTLARAERGQANIVALFGHDELEFLGSTASGNLKLGTDERGLRVELRLPETQRGNDLAALFKAGEGAAMGMSFGFSLPSRNGERWSEDGATRELTELRLHEVSLLSGGQTPAYPATIGLGSVRALANRLGVQAEEARDAVDSLLAGTLDEARTAILIRALGGTPAPDAIIEDEVQPEVAVPASTLVALAEVRGRAK